MALRSVVRGRGVSRLRALGLRPRSLRGPIHRYHPASWPQAEVVVVGAGPDRPDAGLQLALGGVTVTGAGGTHPLCRTSPGLSRCTPAPWNCSTRVGWPNNLVAPRNRRCTRSPRPKENMNLRELPTRYGMVLIVPQSGTEQVLEARAAELGVEVRRGSLPCDWFGSSLGVVAPVRHCRHQRKSRVGRRQIKKKIPPDSIEVFSLMIVSNTKALLCCRVSLRCPRNDNALQRSTRAIV